MVNNTPEIPAAIRNILKELKQEVSINVNNDFNKVNIAFAEKYSFIPPFFIKFNF